MVDNDKMVKYYTGLPSYEVLKTIFDLVIIGVPSSRSASSCSLFQQFLIVMIKLHLNLGDQYIAYRFGVNQSTISRYFNRWLDILYHKLSVSVSWPEQEELLKTRSLERILVNVPCCFEVFANITYG